MSRSEYLFGQYLSHAPHASGGCFHRQHYSRHGMAPVQQISLLEHGHSYLRRISGLPDTYRPLRDGQSLGLGGRRAEVLSGGGHSPEQLMLHLPQEGVFFAADQVIERISPNVSVLASEPEADPLGEFLQSLQRIAKDIPEGTLGLSGHRMPILDLQGRIAALIKHHGERCDFLVDLLAKAPMTLNALTPRLFTRPLDAHQYGFAFAETLAHVNRLLAEGRVEAEESEGKLFYRAKV